ncbi:MAG: hypothetical protein WCP69_09490 [Bacteroidota bacterium]
MKKDERYVVVKLETRSMIRKLSESDRRTMKAYLENLIKNEYIGLKELIDKELDCK